MTRPVTVDLELSHLSEENRWEVSNTEEYIKTLEVEVKRLRETEKKLRVINHSLKDDQAIYFSRNLELEQERDQLKAQVNALTAAISTSGVYKTNEELCDLMHEMPVHCLAQHDAEVIERLIADCVGPHEGFNLPCKQWLQDYANQLRQQAKEVQS